MGDHEWQLIQEINRKLDKLCVDVAASTAAQQTLCKAQCALVADMQADIYGNGKPGIKHDIAYLMEKDAQAKKIVAAAIALILSNIGTLAAWAWNNL